MSSLSTQIECIIQEAINTFSNKIADTYDIKQEDLIDLWRITTGMDYSIHQSSPDDTKPIPKHTKKLSTCSEGSCPYIFVKGAREGQRCGSKGKNGGVY